MSTLCVCVCVLCAVCLGRDAAHGSHSGDAAVHAARQVLGRARPKRDAIHGRFWNQVSIRFFRRMLCRLCEHGD